MILQNTANFHKSCLLQLWYQTEAVTQRRSAKNVFLKFRKIHRKTPVPESLFNKVAGLRPGNKER